MADELFQTLLQKAQTIGPDREGEAYRAIEDKEVMGGMPMSPGDPTRIMSIARSLQNLPQLIKQVRPAVGSFVDEYAKPLTQSAKALVEQLSKPVSPKNPLQILRGERLNHIERLPEPVKIPSGFSAPGFEEGARALPRDLTARRVMQERAAKMEAQRKFIKSPPEKKPKYLERYEKVSTVGAPDLSVAAKAGVKLGQEQAKKLTFREMAARGMNVPKYKSRTNTGVKYGKEQVDYLVSQYRKWNGSLDAFSKKMGISRITLDAILKQNGLK